MIILQNNASFETRHVRMACLLDRLEHVNCSLENLGSHDQELARGAVPVGSVEFVREAMRVAGIHEPQNLSYPEAAQRFLGRPLHKVKLGQVLQRCFIKPVRTKLFTGFVYDPSKSAKDYDEHEKQCLMELQQLSADELMWISPAVKFVSEWRYYVLDGNIEAVAQYDQNEEVAGVVVPKPDTEIVHECIEACAIDHPFALDMGVLDDGRTVLVEANDFWAIGLYGHTLTPAQYLNMLRLRWDMLLQTKGEKNGARK